MTLYGRQFARFLLVGVLVATALPRLVLGAEQQADPPRPNILWITCEDMSPNLGCCGDKYAVTPNLDRFAKQGVHYTRAFAAASVCTPESWASISMACATNSVLSASSTSSRMASSAVPGSTLTST